MAGSAHQPLRLVLDTNVVVAGLLWNGPPRRLIELAIEGEAVELYSSAVLLDELAHTLSYSKFAARIESFGTSIAALARRGTRRGACWPAKAVGLEGRVPWVQGAATRPLAGLLNGASPHAPTSD